jgi:hypothetical protein
MIPRKSEGPAYFSVLFPVLCLALLFYWFTG